MKAIIYLGIALVSINMARAQATSQEKLRQEITVLQQRVQTLQEEKQYLKEALDLRKQGQEAFNEDIHIRLTSVVGHTANKEIVVKGLVTYKGAAKQSLQFATSELTLPQGGQYHAYSSGLVNDQSKTFHINPAEADISYGFSMRFKGVGEKTPTISLLRLEMYGGGGVRNIHFNFKGVDVIWQ